MCSGPQGGGLRRSRSDLSAMRVLAGRRVAVKTCPLGWACPTAESDARDDSPTADGGLSLAPDSSPCRARVLPPCVGSSLGPWPGCPCRASGAGDPPRSLATTGPSGASHGRRRLSAGRPRPADAGGPAPPDHVGGARVACGSVPTRGVRHQPWRRCPSTAGAAAPPVASRRLWRRFVHLGHRAHGSAMDARRATGGWLTLTRQGLATLPETPSLSWRENAGPQALPEAEAQRRLQAVGSRPFIGELSLLSVYCHAWQVAVRESRNMHPRRTSIQAEARDASNIPSNPQVCLRSLTNTQGLPHHRLPIMPSQNASSHVPSPTLAHSRRVTHAASTARRICCLRGHRLGRCQTRCLLTSCR